MKKRFTILAAAFALLAFLAIPMGMRGQTTVTFTAGTDTAQSGEKRPTGDGGSQTLYAGLAELLRHSIHEENNGGMEQLAAEKIPNVHLEAMEEAEDQITKSAQTGHTGEVCIYDSKQQKGILVHGRNHIRGKSHFK